MPSSARSAKTAKPHVLHSARAAMNTSSSSERARMSNTIDLLYERISELELVQEDAGWHILGSSDTDREFSRTFLCVLCHQARLYYLKNPHIRRSVDLQAAYVFGQGFTITAKDENANIVLQEFWDDTGNADELTSHSALLAKEADLQITGNIFFVFFTNDADGMTKVRSIHQDEVLRIVTNPQDRRDKWFYYREWQEYKDVMMTNSPTITKKAYYPDWRHDPPSKPAQTKDGIDILWDYPIYHVAVGKLSDMLFGVPEVYPALDWANAYKRFLENWAMLVESLSQFAWKQTVKGGAQAVQGVKAKINQIRTQKGMEETSPVRRSEQTMPIGGTWIGGEGSDIAPIPKTGASISAEDGRRLLLNICAATGWPETVFGDVSVGTLATAKSLNRQILWGDILANIGTYILQKRVESPAQNANIESDEVQTSFPPIVQHDVLEVVDAIVEAATLKGGMSAGTIPEDLLSRLLMDALSSASDIDIDAEMEKMANEQTPATPEIQAARVRAKTYAHLAVREREAERAARVTRSLARGRMRIYGESDGPSEQSEHSSRGTGENTDDGIEEAENIQPDDIEKAKQFWQKSAPAVYKHLLDATPTTENPA